jgi:hypothetical protein
MGRLKAQGYLYGLPEDAEAVRARLKAAGKLTGVSEQAPSLPRTGTEDGPTLYRIARP